MSVEDIHTSVVFLQAARYAPFRQSSFSVDVKQAEADRKKGRS